jgi:hypothetical protein
MADDTGEIGREAAESVGFANIKTLGDGPAFYSNMALANSIAHQQALNQISQAGVAKAVEMILNTAPGEGATDAAIAQILSKLAGNTPPVTP